MIHWFLTDNLILRAALAAVVSFALALALGRPLIRTLGRRLRERIVTDSPTLNRLHQHKEATPTMGGLFVVAAIVLALALLGNWNHGYLPAVLLLLVGFTAVGSWDDVTKIRRGRGIRPAWKLATQTIVAAAAVLMVYGVHLNVPGALGLTLPGAGTVSLGWWFIPLGVLVVVGSSNAVNLTDGLDGLAGGCLVFAYAAIGAVAFAVGEANLASSWDVLHLQAAGEMSVVCGAALGAVLGFLRFNCHPARVFLGDTGSLPLGGLLGLLAVIVRQELLLVLIAGVFVAEAISVILQVGYYKLRKRRIFLCAPLHHHFQFLGWPESKIVVRFWIAAALCAAVGLGSLQGGSLPRLGAAWRSCVPLALPMHTKTWGTKS